MVSTSVLVVPVSVTAVVDIEVASAALPIVTFGVLVNGVGKV